jgi:hypothetical protein
MSPNTEGELIRLRNRITALEANGSELLARAERAERLSALCSCGSTYETYEGPEVDCAVHGAVRAFNDAQAAIERVRALCADAWRRGVVSGGPFTVAAVVATLDAPESNAPAPSPVSAATGREKVYEIPDEDVTAATEAHGETTEAQEGSR